MTITARTFVKTLSLALLGLLSGSLLYASTPVATLTCQSAQGSTLRVAVFQFTVVTQVAYLSLDVAALGPLLAAQAASTTYATCTLDNNAASASMSNVTVSYLTATGIGQGFASTQLPEILPALTAPQLYASADLIFGSLTVGGVTTQATKAGAATSALTNQAKNPALIPDKALAKLRSEISKALQAQSLGSR